MTQWLPNLRYGLDGRFCAAVALLLGWGLVMVSSASVSVGERYFGNPLYFFERQVVFIILGLVIGFATFTISMESWQRNGPLLLGCALLLLMVVKIPHIGLTVNHAQRWLNFGIFRLQASEPARLFVIVYLAGYIVRRQVRLQQNLMGLVAPFIPLTLICALLLAEPDFGATAILLAVAMLMLFLGGARAIYFVLTLGAAVVAMAIIAMAAAYRMKRLMSFMDPWADAERSGFQLTQSLIAIGNGSWSGVGLGNSLQKLLYLPETHTDFIFAILAEEFGLIGIVLLLLLFALLVWRGFAIAAEAELRGQPFSAYLCYGLSGWLGLQALINMAVNMGMLPTKGLTLPFISYGGSSLVTVMVMIALILRVDLENRMVRAGHPSIKRQDRGAAHTLAKTKTDRMAPRPGATPDDAGLEAGASA